MTPRPTLTVSMLLAVVVLTGCKSSSDKTGATASLNPNPAGITASPSLSSPSPSASAPATPKTPKKTSGPAPVTYPDSAKEYSQAALDAWLAGDKARLDQLTKPGAAYNFAHIPGHPNTNWHYDHCEGDPSMSACVFYNDDGDMFRFRLRNVDQAAAHELENLVFDPTTYPNTPDAYVDEFMHAWQDGNSWRMKALSAGTTFGYFNHYTYQHEWTLTDDHTAGHTHVHITNANGFDHSAVVTNQYLGHPHAITNACAATMC